MKELITRNEILFLYINRKQNITKMFLQDFNIIFLRDGIYFQKIHNVRFYCD